MELNTALELLIDLATENEALKKVIECAKNSDSNLAYAMGVSDENESLERKVRELEEKVDELEHEKMYSTDNLIYVSPNFQYVLQNATHEHMEKQAEMILKLYELVFAQVHARKEVMDANRKLFEFMENGLTKGVQ